MSRTALLGLLAAGVGSRLFDAPADPLGTVVPFLLTTLATGALIIELTDQARRSPARWTRTDAVIVAVLLAYAVLLAVGAALGYLTAAEEAAAVGFAALYAVLAGCFGWVRWRTLPGRPAQQ